MGGRKRQRSVARDIEGKRIQVEPESSRLRQETESKELVEGDSGEQDG